LQRRKSWRSFSLAKIKVQLNIYPIKNHDSGEPTNWNMVFALPAGVFTIALGIFIAYGTAETRVWALNKKPSLQQENSNRKETILESSLSPNLPCLQSSLSQKRP
jgi:hypothetical protein